jgi:hypothetical protein
MTSVIRFNSGKGAAGLETRATVLPMTSAIRFNSEST